MSTGPDEYDGAPLFLEAQAGDDPFTLFERWLDAARASEPELPEAFALATCSEGGQPHCRMMLLKGVEGGCFHFYTNYESTKGTDLGRNPRAALLFYWKSLGRQVRVEGVVERLPAEDSDAYFATRPRESQLAAWASRQSRPVANREALDAAYRDAASRFEGASVPRPPHWGGFALTPALFEFWQGQPGRLHDRIRYRRSDAEWIRERLQP